MIILLYLFESSCRASIASGRVRRGLHLMLLGLSSLLLGLASSQAASPAAQDSASEKPAAHQVTGKTHAIDTSAPQEKSIGVDIKAAIREQMLGKTNLMLVVRDKSAVKTEAASEPAPAAPVHATPAAAHAPAVAHAPATKPVAAAAKVSTRVPVLTLHVGASGAASAHTPAVNPRASREYIRAKAAALTGHKLPAAPDAHAVAHGGDAHGGEPHWAYEGDNGPQAWGKLKPEFNACAIGKRQSPINIEDNLTLQGPAEPLAFNYNPSTGSVVNNGHTIQVDVVGDNTLTVRGSVYKLVQMHFHTPSEEQVNYRSFAMVAHLVHKSNDGQLAVVAVLLDPGVANPLINKVWTYMPLDLNDRVRMPGGILDMNELLPKDQRYYQFIGSLTTPPCTEGVLWMVLKTPTQLSAAQIRLFQQLFPNNARPVQPVNGRPVRDAQ